LFAFPSELFDSTFEENERRIRRFFRFNRHGPAKQSTRRRRIVSISGCIVAGAAIFTTLEAPLHADLTTFVTFIGFCVAVAATNFGLVAADWMYVRRKYDERGLLHTVPGGLVVGAICVLASKAFSFEPGYVYGVVAGWVFQQQMSKRDQGEMSVMTTFLLLAVAVATWFGRAAVTHQAEAEHARTVWIGVEAAMTGLFILSLENAVIGTLPIRFMRGRAAWKWNKPVWGLTTFVTLMVFVHILLSPGAADDNPTAKVFGVWLTFGVFSVAFWSWFRFRPEPEEAVLPAPTRRSRTAPAVTTPLPWTPPARLPE
jgi:hypothetical protein